MAVIGRFLENSFLVMAGLVPAIHVFLAAYKTWMLGTRLHKAGYDEFYRKGTVLP